MFIDPDDLLELKVLIHLLDDILDNVDMTVIGSEMER